MINNSNFRIQVPDYHPIVDMYERDEWWREQKRRCIEGYWVSGKWMPPELYYYVNFHHIKFEDDGGFATAIGLPFLRDIEWTKARLYAEACGFSGFELDEEYTCHRWYGPEKERAIKYGKITEEEVAKKKYISAREYLNKIHPKNLGKPLYHNTAKNVLDLEGRGSGKSYWASACIAHNFLFDGARDYDEHLRKRRDGNPYVSDTVVGAIDAKFSNDLLSKVKVGVDNLPGAKTIVNNYGETEVHPSPLSVSITGSLAPGRNWRSGTESVLNHRTFQDNPLAANGTRPNRSFLEECFAGGTKVRMADLSVKNIEDVKLGEFVLGADGKPKEVGRVVSGTDLMYKVSQARGMDYIVNSQHLIYTEQRCNVKDIKDDGIKLIRAEDFNLRGKYKMRTTFGKTSGLINLEKPHRQRLRIEPYYFGAWLGDGLSSGQGIVVNKDLDYEIYEYIKDYTERLGLNLVERTNEGTNKCKYDLKWIIPTKGHGRTNVLRSALRYYEVLNNKRIPNAYFRADEQQRLELLAGIIDTDGNLSTNTKGTTHNYEIGVSKRKGLVDDIVFLARSLGFDVHVTERLSNLGYDRKIIEPRMKYRISIKGEIWRIPCKIARKQIQPWEKTNAINSTPLKVECIGEGKYYGITLLAAKESDRLFLLEDNTIVHNCGFMNNIKEAWGAIEATQAAAQHKRLVIYGLGTGGLTTAGAAMYTREIFYNPEDYNCLVFEDVWEKKGDIGFFLPAWKCRNEFKEGPDLITNEAKAKMAIEEEIEDAKKGGSKIQLLAKIINNPMKPSEIFLRQEGNKFPTQDLKQALADLEADQIKLKSSYKVDLLEKTKNEITMVPSEKKVITEYPLGKNDTMDACIEIYQKPKLSSDGRVFSNRFILGNDPVDDDGNDDTTRSLQSTFVLDTWTDKIVAEYTARTYLASEYYENVRKLCIMYNAKLMYENNRKGLYAYFKNKHALFYLAETPQVLKDQELIKSSGIGNRALGVNMSNDRVKLFGIDLLLEWLEKPSYDNPDIKNLYTIRSQALLKELISFSMDINADRVSAMIALMIYRAELDFQIESTRTNTVKSTADSELWGRAFKSFNKDKVHRNMNNLLNNYDVR